MQDSQQFSKVRNLIAKNQELLVESKHYEFGQKIKLLSHRKMQGKKYIQAELLLQSGIERLSEINEIEDNIILELYQQLCDLYKEHQQLLTHNTQKTLMHLLTKKDLKGGEIKLFADLIKSVKNKRSVSKIAQFVVAYRIRRKSFNSVLSIVGSLSPQIINDFMRQWQLTGALTPEEIPALHMRLTLFRAIVFDMEAAEQYLCGLPQAIFASPYFRFTNFLLKSVNMRSKQAYETIQSAYEEFLHSDNIFKDLYKSIGVKYFNKKSSDGLLSLLEA